MAKMKNLIMVAAAMVLLAPPFSGVFAQDAQTFMIRGQAAKDMAKSRSDLETAAREFEQAAALDPNLAEARLNLGQVYEKLGRYDEAVSNMKQYLDLRPDASDRRQTIETITRLINLREKARSRAFPTYKDTRPGDWARYARSHSAPGQTTWEYVDIFRCMEKDTASVTVSWEFYHQGEKVTDRHERYPIDKVRLEGAGNRVAEREDIVQVGGKPLPVKYVRIIDGNQTREIWYTNEVPFGGLVTAIATDNVGSRIEMRLVEYGRGN